MKLYCNGSISVFNINENEPRRHEVHEGRREGREGREGRGRDR
ncbi:MAG: hypothetical protein ACKO9I_07715 [Sphaerospermopsis kisseleviana]